jgi:hypothetical protein
MPGTTAWFADSVYLAPGFPTTVSAQPGWQTLMQWKDAGGTRSSSPPVELEVRNGQFEIHGGGGCPSGRQTYDLPLSTATTGKWNDFEFQIHFGRAGDGWLETYVNGQMIGNRFYPPCGTIYPAPYAAYSILRVGYYRDPKITLPGTVIHDEYRMGPTRSSVSLYG